MQWIRVLILATEPYQDPRLVLLLQAGKQKFCDVDDDSCLVTVLPTGLKFDAFPTSVIVLLILLDFFVWVRMIL